ncbi:DHA2 family efflux MFS transporter permease subunit [Kitasatospora sp. NPDC004240]
MSAATAVSPAGTSPRPAGPRTAAVGAVVVLGSLMTVLDTTIVNVALDHLTESFHAPLSTVQWVTTGYTLALATVTPVTAWAIGRFGTRRLYLTAITLFVLGSVLAGAAWDAPSLVAFRVLQGLGGGMVMPVGMTVLVRAADPGRTGRTMSVLGIPVLVGPLAGPVLGGWLVDQASWRWIFLVNLPVGLLALFLAARLLPRDGGARAAGRLDLPGLLMLSPGLAALIYGLATGAEAGGLGAPAALLPVLAGAALVAAFVVRALRTAAPLLDLRLLGRRSFAAPAATLVLFVGGYFGSMLLLPLYYQLIRGQSATGAGLLGIPQALATGLTMRFAGRLVDRVAPGRVVLTGVAVAATGFLAFTGQLAADTPYWRLVAALTVMGVGVGMTMMPAMAAATRGVAPEEVPAASTMTTIVQQVGGSAGTALMSVLLTGALADRLPGAAMDGGGLAAVHALDASARTALAPALAEAFRDTYGWAVALIVLALLPALLLPRRTPRD